MGTSAYKRIPWGKSELTEEELAGEEIELADISETSGITVGEGVTGATETTALLGEEAAVTAEFLTIEEAAAGLDATGVGVPVGVTVGILAGAGFGAYEIYEHLIKSKPKVTYNKVQREHKKYHKEKAAQKPINYKDISELPDESTGLDIETLEKQGLVPPPFKYLGPGNSINRGSPYNQIDSDAKKHDIQYSQATTKEEVQKSDKEFISKSRDHIAEGLSGKGSISDIIGATIGGIGIGFKYNAEKLTDKTFYPNLGKLWLPPLKIELLPPLQLPLILFIKRSITQQQKMELNQLEM